MRSKTRIRAAVGLMVAAVAVTAGGGVSRAAVAGTSRLPQGSEPVVLRPADFTTRIDNPYWPMKPGSRWIYRETDPDGTKLKVVIVVTNKTKKVANGITARVVRDTVTANGVLVEDTIDWYAQDKGGNIWYLGEFTKEYEQGKVVSTKGSFEAGVDGAQPGIAMPANPTAGLSYRQEYYAGQAEDTGSILSLREQVEVPFGHFGDIVMTRDLNSLKPKSLEYKFFARGVGPVLAIGVSGGSGREELVRFTRGG